MANIIRTDYRRLMSSDAEQVLKVQSEFNDAFEADRRNRERAYRNWKAYFAVDGGQWEDATRDKLHQNNRHAAQYNIIGPKVDAMAGSLMQEKNDLDWKPTEGTRNKQTEGVKVAYYSDKDLCNYDKHTEQTLIDGLVYGGIIKMQMSAKYNPLKNIAFVRTIPGYVIDDPYWVTDDDDDLMRCWEVFHMHPEVIANKFDIMTQELDEMIKLTKRSGNIYDNWGRDPNELILLQQKGSLLRIVEEHYIECVNTMRLSGQKIDSKRWVNFPLTTDHNELEAFMVKNMIDPMTLQEFPYQDKIHKVRTICSEGVPYKFLENGVSAIQPGRLPYYHFEANRSFGQCKGLVDDIWDLQTTINKRESKLTDMIATAQGGGKLVNRNLFPGPEEMQRFREKANDPSYIEFVDGDELNEKKVMHYINSNQYPSQIVNQLMRMWDIVDRISKVPAALEAISENANESGILFEQKVAIARLNTLTLINRKKDMERKMAEGYFMQYQLAYNGFEREFTTPDGRETITVNKRVFNQKDGKIYIENRPAMVPRCQVVITESKSAPNRMLRDRAIYTEMFNFSLKSGYEKYAKKLFQKLFNTLDLSAEEKEEFKLMAEEDRIKDQNRDQAEVSGYQMQTAQAQLGKAQAQITMQQLLQQIQPQQPQVDQTPMEDLATEAEFTEVEEQPEEQPQLMAADQV